ncbi:MAG: T9SS type A sorting domain-containing protein [Bacteroidetes bacterium]|nr:T9SS type A sorting domain-containing protein [Bacteroidota bacterium]
MKKTILFILAFIVQTEVFSQSCLPDGIKFSTQTEIDNFHINYPNCTEIEGDVTINGPTEISNLLGLSVLESINGNLYIDINLNLNSLSGLENLTYVGGELQIWNNPAISNLDNLSSLEHVGALYIASNDSLTNITGLSMLDSIEYFLHIEDNELLNSISGLENITGLSGNVDIGNYYGGLPLLEDLSGLDNLVSVGGDLLIAGNHSLTNLSGLNNLSYVGGKLWINNNDSLVDLNGLNNLSSTSGLLWITSNNSLVTLAALDSIVPGSLIDLWISNNNSLQSCDIQCICSYLSSPTGTVSIYNNSTGCDNPSEIANICGITMPCLPYGNYYFTNQSDIDNFQSNYPNCTNLEGDIYIDGNDITNLEGLNTINSIGEFFQIGHMYGGIPTLTDLSGLENLESIGGTFNIINNDLLNDISALNNLTMIASELRIENNPNLNSLSGIDNIESNSMYKITISGNSMLSTCEVKSICEFIALPNSNVYIDNNATGCNSIEEVEYACSVFVHETNKNKTLSIYPNPTDRELFISTQEGLLIIEVIIYNNYGQIEYQSKITNNNIDISKLRTGIYIIEIVNNKFTSRQKLIIK